jgi:4-amino-4-deoxy-L-arabinose transferase-like glycosyltransferase
LGVDRHLLLALLAIAAVGLTARLGAAWVLGLDAPLRGDEPHYSDAAASLAAGRGFTIHGVATAARLPGWPLLLAGPTAIFGTSSAVARIASCLVGGFLVLTLGLAAFRVGGRIAALIAAGAAAAYPPLVFHSTQVMSDIPATFWVALATWLLLEGRARGALGWFFGSGLAFGMACLTRAPAMAFLGATCLALAVVPRRERPAAFGRAAVLCAGAALVLWPWIARNVVVVGRPTLSTQTPGQLWQGAHAGATGLNRIDWPRTKQRSAELQALGETRSSAVMGREAAEFIRQHPLEYARLGLVKAWELWKPWAPTMSLAANLAYALGAGPLLILGVASGLSRRRSRFDRVYLVAGLGLFTLVHMAYTSVVRYRLPADALLVIYAAVLLAELPVQRVARPVSQPADLRHS